MSENFAHQANLFDPQIARPVIIAGAGSIGSMTALALAKMGVSEITVWDDDVVSSHNAPMSLYRGQDVARKKVDVLSELLKAMSGIEVKTVSEMHSDQPLRNATVIACVDTMSARLGLWKQVKGQITVDLFIDTRTVESYAEVYAVSPRLAEECEQYEATLYSDETAARQTCGTHGVMYVSMSVAAAVAATAAQYWTAGRKKWCHAVKCDTLEIVRL